MTMTVRQLRKRLKKMRGDLPVLINIEPTLEYFSALGIVDVVKTDFAMDLEWLCVLRAEPQRVRAGVWEKFVRVADSWSEMEG
jgi:hypothetical protein